jgi:hypothetical protein
MLVRSLLGIGTSSPVAKIHIQGSGTSGQVTSSLILENSSSGTAGLQITGTAGSSHLDFMYGGAPSTGTNTLTTGMSMTLEGSGAGNVGIGTDSPTRRLSLVNLLADPIMTIRGAANNTGGIFFGDDGDDYIGQINYDHSTNAMEFATSAAEAMRLDASGNLLVGKTDSDTNVEGSVLFADSSSGAAAAFTSDGIRTIIANRKTDDGEIISIRKDGTTVGSIGTQGGDLNIGTAACGIAFVDGVPAIYPWTTTGNTTSDAAIDLGDSGGRFKDLYLSGGVYLGGTGAANLLDDYEEGTWTPSFTASTTAPTIAYNTQTASYTKIGNTVTYTIFIVTNSRSGGSGNLSVTGLPFTVATGQDYGSTIGFNYKGKQAGILFMPSRRERQLG